MLKVMPHPLVDKLDLSPHPEGGYYRETYRSQQRVESAGIERSAMTLIYFLLEMGQHSVWHRVLSDEAWHFYQGDDLELLIMSPDGKDVEFIRLGEQHERHAVVPAHYWQAARPLGDYALVGCTVSPGFEFADFLLLRDHPQRNLIAAEWIDLL